MKNFILPILFCLPLVAVAQKPDSLFVAQGADGRWHARYFVRDERSVFAVAKKYGVPAAALADANGLSYAHRLERGMLVKVPLTVANWYNYTPPASSLTEPLYYRAAEEWDAKDLAAELGVSKKQFAAWNGGDGDVERNDIVAVGWISVGPVGINDVGQTAPADIPPPPLASTGDTMAIIGDFPPAMPVLAPIEQAFQDQTAGGTMVAMEKGPAAFFPSSGGTSKGVHYAFHNAATRGSVVRIHNVGTGRTVYAKVLGPLPGTKQYVGAIVGISAAAKAELGVRGDARAWCEVSYAGY